MDNLAEHIASPVLLNLRFFSLNLSITFEILSLFIAAFLAAFFFFWVINHFQLVPGRLQSLFEIVYEFLDNECSALLGKERNTWLPFLLALFSFILFANLLSMLPGFISPTSNINVTAALALIIFFTYQAAGIKKQGLINYFKHLSPPDMPFPMLFFLVPLEIISQLARPFSLALRLFANLLAGHTLLLITLSALVSIKIFYLWTLPIAGNVILRLFEIFVAFIQAFIFTYLSAMYIGEAVNES